MFSCIHFTADFCYLESDRHFFLGIWVGGSGMRKRKSKARFRRTVRAGNSKHQVYLHHSSFWNPPMEKQKTSQYRASNHWITWSQSTSKFLFCKVHVGIVSKTFHISALEGNCQAADSLSSVPPRAKMLVDYGPFQTWSWQGTEIQVPCFIHRTLRDLW